MKLTFNLTFLPLQSSSSDGAFLARHALLKSGIPLQKPAMSVNRLCGSGFQAIASGAQVGREFHNSLEMIFDLGHKTKE